MEKQDQLFAFDLITDCTERGVHRAFIELLV
ncbi:hypothetical protein EMIT0P74_80133 [Pseudomonas sp. IT-P74]